ncbi:MAG TPA: hypothetical protein VFT72_14170 [Opitutaceae bacterium]|nr:hypothetical protein [Opitutaceae bacterium]
MLPSAILARLYQPLKKQEAECLKAAGMPGEEMRWAHASAKNPAYGKVANSKMGSRNCPPLN